MHTHQPRLGRAQAPNLGGLARTAEILGASGLVVADARVTSDTAFVGTSVTAERWVPLLEVPEVALVPWLLGRRQEGCAPPPRACLRGGAGC